MKTSFRLTAVTLLAAMLTVTSGAETLRFGVLPAIDAVPYLVAQSEGLFAAAGLDVKIVSFKSPIERDTAFQAGAVDGTIGDVPSSTLAASKGFGVSIVAATEGRYLLLVSPKSNVRSLKELAGVPIGGSTNSVIHFTIDRLLTKAGVAAADIKVMAVPSMPVRLEMLVGGQLAAACLPEPLATAAVNQGARILGSSEDLGEDPGVLFFSKSYVAEHPASVKAFLAAGAQAGAAINADNDRYRQFLVDQVGLPESIRTAFRFVNYRAPRVASEASFSTIWTWMKGRGLIVDLPAPASLIDRQFTAAK
jgi:NitT/TauT family transport system substrate-binding protein